jgi:hypothetical protein
MMPEKLEIALRAEEKKLNDLGYDAAIGFIYSGETAMEKLEEALKENSNDVVLIGAGVRKDDDHFFIFEKLVNIVHEHAVGSFLRRSIYSNYATFPEQSNSNGTRRWMKLLN